LLSCGGITALGKPSLLEEVIDYDHGTVKRVGPFAFLAPGVGIPPGRRKSRAISNKAKLRLVLLSELELATKLSDGEVLSNVGELIRDYEGKIDGIVINGGLAYIPDRYSRLRGERLDLVEDRLRERYGRRVYKEVKRGANNSDSVEDLVEAARLARAQMRNIALEAKKKGIPIMYIYGTTDYRNVKMIMEALERLGRRNQRAHKKQSRSKLEDLDEDLDEDEPEEIEDWLPDEAESLLSVIPEDYKFKASDWKSVDKNGIKDKANDIYRHLLHVIFGDADLTVYKRFENFAGDNRPDAEIRINGLRVKVFHAINGLTSGLNEGKPTDRNLKLVVDYASLDAKHGRLGDIYITGRGSATEFVAVNFQGRENPVLIMNQGPLLDIDRQFRLRESFNRTDIAKRLFQFEDSAMSILTLRENGVVEIDHIDLTGIRKKIWPGTLEEELSSGSMYELTTLTDWHVGSAYADEVAMEAVPGLIEKSVVPREYRNLFDGGDMVDGGNDKAQRTKMSQPRVPPPEDLLNSLESVLQKRKSRTRRKILESLLHDVVYGHSETDIGRQLDRLFSYIAPLGELFSTVYATNGNHFEKATGNGSEARAKAFVYRNGGAQVVFPDELQENGQNPTMGPYVLTLVHSPGYRGGLDARTTLMNTLKTTGQNLVDVVAAADCHEAGIAFSFTKRDDEWRTLIAMTAPSLQRATEFERYVLHKLDYTKGMSRLYLPTDPSIGTSLVKYQLIPAQTMHAEVEGLSGSRFHRVVTRIMAE
jgi:hypothetical protein